MSQRQVALQRSAPDASALLNNGCPLDHDPAQFEPEMWTRTVIGMAEIVLWRKGAAEFRLETWRFCAEYVLGWLHEATR